MLWAWRLHCAYYKPEDWIFASPAKKGKFPYWPNSIYRVYLRPVLQNDLKIKEPVGWHTLRHSLGTLVKVNGEDVKTIEETLRHANFKATMDVYTQSITEIRRSARSRVVRQIMSAEEGKSDEE
jgi:integrase